MTDISAPIYQLRYSLTREDIAAFEFLPRELQGAEKLWLFGPVLACGAAVGLFEDRLAPLLPWDPSSKPGQVLIVLCAIAVGYALSMLLLTLRARYLIARAHVPSAASAIDAFADRLTVKQDGVARTFAWRDLVVSTSGAHVFLEHAPREAIIIPMRAFADDGAMRSFAAYAEEMGRDKDADVDGTDAKNNNKETAA